MVQGSGFKELKEDGREEGCGNSVRGVLCIQHGLLQDLC